MSQKEIIFNAIVEVAGSPVDNTISLTKDQRKEVAAILVQATVDGQIKINGKTKNYDFTTEEGMQNVENYWPGTIDNWLRKDTRLNGGVKYETKNPGSRAGMQNKQVKATRGYIKSLEEAQANGEDVSEKLELATSTLEKLLAEEAIKRAEKLRKKYSADDLPEELRHLVS